MTLNGVMAVILRYFTEFGKFCGALRKSDSRYTSTFCNKNFAQRFSFYGRPME